MKCIVMCSLLTALAQQNPPSWPATVQVFGPETSVSDIKDKVEAAFANNGGHMPPDHGQFSKDRYAFLFKPGSYEVDVPVGYYTQVVGLGEHPTDVKFVGGKGVYSDEGSYTVKVGALNSFWRAAENFQSQADYPWIAARGKGMLWAGSQAAPLRRVVVDNDLFLYVYRQGETAGDFSSGGFMANSQVNGTVASGSQQQWLTRNSEVESWPDGVWNMVFVGTKGAPASHCGMSAELCNHAVISVDETPKIAEKPFITIDTEGKYTLNIPQVSTSRIGIDFSLGRQVDFEKVYVTDALVDTAESINNALNQGMHIVMSPGIYNLEASLELKVAGQVLLGLGFPTLIAANGQPAVTVANVDGVRVAGVLLQAGKLQTQSLLQWGEAGFNGNSEDPGFLHDVFMRVGGPAEATGTQVDTMLQLNAGNVIGDNLWLWRADHVEGGGLVSGGDNPCQHAAVIGGDDIIMYGLAAEHTLQDIVQWNGNRGQLYFFQSELPYDVTQDFADQGNTGYRVGADVTQHVAYGVGVYHYFRDFPVTLAAGIIAPPALEQSFISPFGVFLNGLGTMTHVLNDKGSETKKGGDDGAVVKWVCDSTPPVPKLHWLRGSQPACKVGDDVICPSDGVGCAGNTCCPNGSVCPSADNDFMCCPKPKEEDCTSGPSPPPSPPPTPSPSPAPTPSPPKPTPSPSPTPSPPSPSPSPTCKVGDPVLCPSGVGQCQGDQCCPDGSICPSASNAFTGCPKPKIEDCTGGGDESLLV